MRINERINRFHRDRSGMASFELMLIMVVVLVVYFLGYNWSLYIRERVELRSAMRTSAWNVQTAGDEFGSVLPCAPPLNGLPLPLDPLNEARLVLCGSMDEESPAEKPFWTDMRETAEGVGRDGGGFERSLIDEVEPEALKLRTATGRVITSPYRDRLGLRIDLSNPIGSIRGIRAAMTTDEYGLTDFWEWTHDEETFEKGHDNVIFQELRKTRPLFPDVYRKAN